MAHLWSSMADAISMQSACNPHAISMADAISMAPLWPSRPTMQSACNSMQSACNPHAISMQSACNQHGAPLAESSHRVKPMMTWLRKGSPKTLRSANSMSLRCMPMRGSCELSRRRKQLTDSTSVRR